MDPKPRPNHRRYVQLLQRMTPGERLAKVFELSEMTKQLFLDGLRARHPHLSDEEIRRLAVQIRAKRR